MRAVHRIKDVGMTTEAVIFDMDGVLTDSEPVINTAAIKGLREFGIEARPEDFLPFVGTGEDRYIGGVAEKYGVKYRPEMKHRVYEIYLDILPGMLERFPGVAELLQAIRRSGTALGLATSADRIKMEANLQAIDVPQDWFAAIVTGEDIEHKKPAPDIYLACASQLGIEPACCCVVEDAVNGVDAARAAQMHCVAVSTSFSEDELRNRAEPDIVRASLADVTLADLGIG